MARAVKGPQGNAKRTYDRSKERNRTMKYLQYFATTGILACMVGCASAPRLVVQELVGPCYRVSPPTQTEGSLLVYSARRSANVDINQEEFFWNNDFGKNEFMYEPAHTDYTIYGPDGKVVAHVRNAGSRNVEIPTPVSLPTGTYTVEAEAERRGTLTMTVLIPVVIEAGQTTTIHLEPNWERSAAPAEPGNVVRLSDGRIIGCRADGPAEHLLGLSASSRSRP